MVLEANAVNEVEVGLRNLLWRVSAEHLNEQRDDALCYERIAVGCEHDVAVGVVGLQPHTALASVDEVLLRLIFRVKRLQVVAKVNEEDDSLQDVPEITNEDFVLGIRPEFLDIADAGALQGEIYGAMPTGMESTVKVRVGEFLLTGVIFGSSLFTIGTKVPLSVTGNQIMLFDRRSGKCITSGSLEF